MHYTLRRAGLTLALSLAGTVFAAPAPILSATQLAAQQAQQPARITQAQNQLLSMRDALGLSSSDGFVSRTALTNDQGTTVVILDQTFDGHRVWGGQAIANVNPDGSIVTKTDSVQTGIALTSAPLLTAAQALTLAVDHLAPQGPMPVMPQVEQVVFPTAYTDSASPAVDATGAWRTDRPSYDNDREPAAYVWAYVVSTHLQNDQDGLKEMTYVIDGNSGAVLRMEDEVQHDTAAKGTGTGLYRGAVTFDDTQMTDGTFALWDTTRGTLPNPGLKYSTQGDGTSWPKTGMQVWYEPNLATGAATYKQWVFAKNPANTWGDGLPFTSWSNEGGTNGQTTGVDTISALQTTWDFYKNVFHRNGMDGKDTTVFAEVLMTGTNYVNNASWVNYAQGMYLGAGHTPSNGSPFGSFADLDVIAHEMTHGVTAATKWANNVGGTMATQYAEPAFAEGTSDFFAQMVKAYSARSATAANYMIPPVGADWKIGSGPNGGTPLRWMSQPSLDQHSTDAWYDGAGFLDGHYSCGVINRALYFLANGASSDPTAANYSRYLPGGMVGIGNDAAARIWFKTVTEKLLGNGTASLTFNDARTAAIAAAQELNGVGSVQDLAVQNAFAAVNLGDAPGQPSRTQVVFAKWRNGDYLMSKNAQRANIQYFPKGEAVTPRVTVNNNTDTRVTWSLGGPSLFNGASSNVNKGGRINEDGSWTTPNQMGWFAVTATSVADPTQFAEGREFLVNLDTDTDDEDDALDMAGVAFSWYLGSGLSMNHSTLMAPVVDNDDVAIFVDAMRSAWPAK